MNYEEGFRRIGAASFLVALVVGIMASLPFGLLTPKALAVGVVFFGGTVIIFRIGLYVVKGFVERR